MATISLLLRMLNGSARQVDLSTNTLSLGAMQLNGSSSGTLLHQANATTTPYTLTWPAAVAASNGYVLTSDTSGTLSWSPAAATGANTALSNLAAVAINTSLLPGTDNSINLGSASKSWASANIHTLVDASSVISVDAYNRLLVDSSAATQLSWSTAGVEFNQLTASTVPYLNSSKVLTSSAVTPTQLGYLSGASGTTGTGNLVYSASPTFTGTAAFAAISATSASFTGALNMNSNQINGLATPSVSSDAATKGYVDAAINGLTWKGPVSAYANSNVALSGGATLTIDGYSVQNGNYVILANQTTASQNYVYVASGIGTAYTLTQVTNSEAPTAIGDAYLIENGTTYGNSAFQVNAITPNVTFIQFAGPNFYSFTAPLQLSGTTVSITQASGSANGYLSSTDWNTFNNKQPAGSYITALTGDVTATGPGSAAATLATVNSNTGTFGSATQVAQFTVNGKGLITAASNVTVTPAFGSVTGGTAGSVIFSNGTNLAQDNSNFFWDDTHFRLGIGAAGAPSYPLDVQANTTNQVIQATSTAAQATNGGGNIAIAANSGAAMSSGNRLGVLQFLGISTGTTFQKGANIQAFAAAGWTSASTPGILKFFTTPSGSTTPLVALTLDQTQNATFAGTVQASNIAAGATVSGTNTGDQTITLTGDVTGSGTGSFATTISAGAVTASKLGTVTDGITTDQNGTSNTIEVLNAPAVKRTLVAGQTFTANTSYLVRWGLTANGETAGRVYAADDNTASFDNFYVIGMASSGTTVSAGSTITVTLIGDFTLSSSDTAFAANTDGAPVFLTTSGGFSTTAPTTTGTAVVRVGIVKVRSATNTANIVAVQPQTIAVN